MTSSTIRARLRPKSKSELAAGCRGSLPRVGSTSSISSSFRRSLVCHYFLHQALGLTLYAPLRASKTATWLSRHAAGRRHNTPATTAAPGPPPSATTPSSETTKVNEKSPQKKRKIAQRPGDQSFESCDLWHRCTLIFDSSAKQCQQKCQFRCIVAAHSCKSDHWHPYIYARVISSRLRSSSSALHKAVQVKASGSAMASG